MVVLAVGVGIAAAAGFAVNSTILAPADPQVINACRLKATGLLRVVDSDSECRYSETALSWNVVGPTSLQGPPGPKGEKGDNGDPGAKGDPGTPGSPGTPGAKGDKGDPGAPGQDGNDGADGLLGTPGAKGDKGDPCLSTDPACVGPKGDPGTPGEKGDQGPAGTAPVAVYFLAGDWSFGNVDSWGEAASLQFSLPNGTSALIYFTARAQCRGDGQCKIRMRVDGVDVLTGNSILFGEATSKQQFVTALYTGAPGSHTATVEVYTPNGSAIGLTDKLLTVTTISN